MHDRNERRSHARAVVATAAWAAGVTAGAVLLHFFPPGRGWLGRAAASEAVHVFAHLALYGTLTLLAFRAARGRTALAVGVTVATGALQEAAQTVLFGVFPGRAEAFDLLVDLCAALGTVALLRLLRRRGAAKAALLES